MLSLVVKTVLDVNSKLESRAASNSFKSIIDVVSYCSRARRYANFALFSCFLNGEPAAAIVAVNRDGYGYAITPLFVSVTPSITLTDHDGSLLAKRRRKRRFTGSYCP